MRLLTITDPSLGALREALADTSLDAMQVIDHLKAGAVVLSARGTVSDRYDSTAPPIPIAYLTDGDWVWSWQTACYVQRYGVGLPADFLSHVLKASTRGEVRDIPESVKAEALRLAKTGQR